MERTPSPSSSPLWGEGGEGEKEFLQERWKG